MSSPARAGVFAVCLVLAVLHTWPLALRPGRYSLNDNADAQLNEWILAWIAHQFPRDPAHLFEANIFYPAHDALAFSEPLIVPGLMGAPLAWSGASPVFVYNLVFMAGFALTAFATCAVAQAWTGSTIAGLVAGSVFAFNGHTLTRLAHVQAIHLYGLSLALLAIDRIVRDGSRRAGWVFVGAFVLLGYTSGYLVVFALVMLPVAVLARTPEWRPHRRRLVPALAIAIVFSALAVLPVYVPYRRVAREQHMTRPLEVVQDFSATSSDYVERTGGFFPGFAIIGLAGVAIAAAIGRRPDAPDGFRWRVVMLIAIGAAGVILSLGTNTPVYRWAFMLFPPIRSLRAAVRFGNLFVLALAMLGGIGVSLLRRRWMAIALLVVVNLESLHAPISYTPFKGIPGIYSQIAREPGHVIVAEVPFWTRAGVFQNAEYELASTAHWRPLMNGYSGYTPESYDRFAEPFWLFPAPAAIAAMRDAGVTHIVVHTSRLNDDENRGTIALESRGDLELVAISPPDLRLYRLTR